MTPSIDSHASLSPLDMLAPPPPRETDRGDSFAQHLQSSSEPGQSSRDQDRLVAQRSSEPERSAQQRSSEQKRSEQAPAKEPVRQSGVSPARDERAEQEEEVGSESTEAAVATEKQADDEDHVSQPVDESEVGLSGEKEEDAAAEPESDLVDELLLTGVPVAPQPISDSPETATPETDATAAAIAAIAEKDSSKPAKGATLEEGRQTRGVPEAAFELQPKTETEATAEAPQATTAAVAEVDAAPTAASAALETTVDAIVASAAPKLEAAQQSGKDAPIQETNADATEGEQPAEEAATSQGQLAVDVDAPTARSRDGKRERPRGDSRTSTPKSDQGDVGAPATTAQADAVAKIEPTAIAAAPTAETRSADATTNVPPPAAPSATATVAQTTSTGQRLPQHLLARGTQRGSAGAPPNPAEQARFVQRVAKAFQTAQSGSGELQLRLSPPELGSLKLEIKVQNGVLTARVEAETATAKSMIVDSLPVLKERLAEQGIQVERFDVDLMDRQPQGQPDSPQERERRSLTRQPHFPKAADAIVTTSPTTSENVRPLSGDGRLNVTV